MGRQGFERISQREFARRLDVSNEAVSQAVKGGKITKGWDKKAGKIIYEKAMEEWGNLFVKANAEGEAATADAMKRLQSVPGPADQQQKPQPQITKPRKERDAADTQQSAFDELEEYELALSNRAPFAEALRVEKVAKAKQEILKLRKEEGTLVNKAEVYRQLFAFGQSVRNAMQAIPDRAIDEVIATPNRATAHQVLTKYIHEALTKLTDVETLSFQEQQSTND